MKNFLSKIIDFLSKLDLLNKLNLFNKKELDSLRAQVHHLSLENQNYQNWVNETGSMDGFQLSVLKDKLSRDISVLQIRINETEVELSEVQKGLLEVEDKLLLENVGVYEYQHVLEIAVEYQEKLKAIRDKIKGMVKQNKATVVGNTLTINGSDKDGKKMAGEYSKLMLRAYNSEIDMIVKALKPYGLAQAKKKEESLYNAINKLGNVMSISISKEYHDLRKYEIELTTDYLNKRAVEQEKIKEQREQEREAEKIQREIELERKKIEDNIKKEREHYKTVMAKIKDGSATPEEVQSVESKIEELSESLEQVNSYEANQKAGYVYVISNIGSFGKDVVKIGMTRRLEPMDRIKELGDASVPFSFDVHALVFSEDAISLENTLHRVFADRSINMVNLRKEFFYVAPHEVKEELAKLDEKYLLDFVEEPVAEEWYRSVPLHNHNTWVKEDEVCARINTNDSNFPNAPIYKTTTGYEIRFDGKIVAIPADKYEIIISSGMGFRV